VDHNTPEPRKHDGTPEPRQSRWRKARWWVSLACDVAQLGLLLDGPPHAEKPHQLAGLLVHAVRMILRLLPG
jgi:hypothetical protein